jgi:hypothetical protein
VTAEVDRVHTRRPTLVQHEDEQVSSWHDGAFHPTLPGVPSGFPGEVPDGFKMMQAEAAWLRDRMLASSTGIRGRRPMPLLTDSSEQPNIDRHVAVLPARFHCGAVDDDRHVDPLLRLADGEMDFSVEPSE